jgi:hypothetical protein
VRKWFHRPEKAIIALMHKISISDEIAYLRGQAVFGESNFKKLLHGSKRNPGLKPLKVQP